MEKKLNWAVMGTGGIAGNVAGNLARHGVHFYGAANRTHEKAVVYAKKYGVEKVFASYDELLADPFVDVVYIATTHNTHYEFIKKALLAGKHVLCEKTITLNHLEYEELLGIASEKGLILAEAMTIYHMPLLRSIRKDIAEGKYGTVREVSANFGFFARYRPQSRLFSPVFGGGALLDLGVYPLSFMQSFFPISSSRIETEVKLSSSGVDIYASCAITNALGQQGNTKFSFRRILPRNSKIITSKGEIRIPTFNRAEKAVYVDEKSRRKTVLREGFTKDALYYEFVDMERAIKTNDPSLMRVEDTKAVLRIMDQIRDIWGVKFPSEKRTRITLLNKR